MLAAGCLFGVMGVFVKLGSTHFSSAELVFYRSLVSLTLISALIRARELPVATRHWKTHAARSVSGFFSLSLYFYAITLLPLATAVTLNYTSPLFLALLTVIVMKQRALPLLVTAIAIGFAGVALLLRPTLASEQLLGGGIGLLSGLLAGVAYLNVKQLSELGEPDWRTVFYFTLLSTLGAGAWMLLHEFHRVDGERLLLLLGMGGSATFAQLAMTRAYRTGEALVVGSLSYSTVLFATLFALLLWGEVPAPLSMAGVILIILSGIVAVRLAPRAPETAD